ncbi:hypothetical protein J7L60_01880 [Candidatus Bathyarchaeota archaeon]|nr:hypothetical protein [Candidatus Bathyarchaeota archaeon]
MKELKDIIAEALARGQALPRLGEGERREGGERMKRELKDIIAETLAKRQALRLGEEGFYKKIKEKEEPNSIERSFVFRAGEERIPLKRLDRKELREVLEFADRLSPEELRLCEAISSWFGWRTPVTPYWLLKEYGFPALLFAFEVSCRTNPERKLSYFCKLLCAFKKAAAFAGKTLTISAFRAWFATLVRIGKMRRAVMEFLLAWIEEQIRSVREVMERGERMVRELPQEIKALNAKLAALAREIRDAGGFLSAHIRSLFGWEAKRVGLHLVAQW